MTVKLFGTKTLKLYYSAPDKPAAVRWLNRHFTPKWEQKTYMQEPLMFYDTSKKYHELNTATFYAPFEPEIKVILTKLRPDGSKAVREYCNKKLAAVFLHIGIERLYGTENGETIKGWEVTKID